MKAWYFLLAAAAAYSAGFLPVIFFFKVKSVLL